MRWVFLQLAVGVTCLRAQFYAPEVYLHDAGQRLFVVEAARVHAWIENRAAAPGQPRIAGVRWKVEGKTEGWCGWRVAWLDEAGKELRAQEIRYSGDSLLRGAEFYRMIWRQIRGLDANQRLALVNPAGDKTLSAFWEASDAVGVERMSALLMAEDWARQEQPETRAEDAGRLAGLLLHGSTPILSGACALDHVMLARATAWLCHAEQLCDARLRVAWPVQLYLSGRENQAGQRWREFFKPGKDDCLAARWWEQMLRNRPAPLRDVVLFAAEADHARLAVPFLAAHLRLDLACQGDLADIFGMLYGDSLVDWAELGSCLTRELAFRMGSEFAATAPALARVRWLQTLAHVAATETGGAHPELSAQAVAALQAISTDPVSEQSCKGLGAASALINRGYALRADQLEPAAAVTVEDLLVYGWDMTLMQMEARHDYLENNVSNKEAAKRVRDHCRLEVPTLMYWLDPWPDGKRPAFPLDRQRVEFFEFYELGLPALLRPSEIEDKNLAGRLPALAALRNPFKRDWLGFSNLEMLRGGTPPGFKVARHLALLQKEGGEDTCARVLRFLIQGWKPEQRERFLQENPGATDRLRKACPNANGLHRAVVLAREEKGAEQDFLTAQELERIYWRMPRYWQVRGYNTINEIMALYVSSHARDAAKRFYRQMLELHNGFPVFAMTMPQRRWVLAWWEGEEAEMRAAFEDANTKGLESLRKQLIHLLARGRDAEALTLLEEGLQIHTPKDPRQGNLLTRLDAFMPLLPALAAPGHPRREEALDHFGDRRDWLVLRFVLCKRFQLPAADAARLLGAAAGDAASPDCRAFQAYARGDADAFFQFYDEVVKNQREGMDNASKTLLQCLRHDLLKTPPVAKQPDLKPKDASYLADLVRAKLKQAGR